MPKVILYIASSVDGYIAHLNGEVDWLFHDQDYGYSDFIAGVGVVLMGRITYEQILSFGEYPYHNTEGYIFSRTRAGERDANVRFLSGDIPVLVAELKEGQERNIWLVGGGQMVREFLLHDLIDEIVLSVHPIILGKSIPLFPPHTPQMGLALIGCQAYNTGLVQLAYQRTLATGEVVDI